MKIKISALIFMIFLSVSAYAQEDTYIVRFNDSMQVFGLRDDGGIDFAVATQEELEEYIEAGIVEHYEPNYEIVAIEPETAQIDATEVNVAKNWNFNMVNAQFANNLGVKGNDVKVAVIDSGIYSDDMLQPQILPGYDYVVGRETNSLVQNDGTSDYHGTVVSSIIARENDNYGTGIAPRVYIVPLRVLNNNKSGDVANLIRAIDDATNKYECDVINISLSLSDSEVTEDNLTMLSQVIKNAVDKGIIVVAAAGNDGNSTCAYPASLDNVISVASVEESGQHSSFSQRNEKVFVSAPGGLMQIAIKYRVENGQKVYTVCTTSGTSFAVPHVSALAAIVKCINPDINYEGFRTLLQETSVDMGEEGRDIYYGYGIIDCESAVKKLLGERKIYISPVDFVNGKIGEYVGRVGVAVIYNNTKSPLTISVLCGLYNNEDKSLISAKIKSDVTLPGEKYATIPVECPTGSVKYMVWDSLKNMVPLAQSSYK